MITNRNFLPEEALNIGMIDQFVPHDDLQKVTEEIAII